MRIFSRAEINRTLSLRELIPLMKDALIAQSNRECDTPMPMHIHLPDLGAELHLKSSYRLGGNHFVVKIAGNHPLNAGRNLPVASGMMLLLSAESGEPVALLCDGGDLTDARTAAAAAMTAHELGRKDQSIGILGNGVQARWQARSHVEVLPLREIWIWGRNKAHAENCRTEIGATLPGVDVRLANSPKEVAQHTRFIVTTTSAREPLLLLSDIETGTLISAVGSDSPGKQELDPAILKKASLILVDSKAQCERLGEVQHTPDVCGQVVDIGEFCQTDTRYEREGIVVADFTGLGIEDLFAAEHCLQKLSPSNS
jgi:ornithine cyclodeaminase